MGNLSRNKFQRPNSSPLRAKCQGNLYVTPRFIVDDAAITDRQNGNQIWTMDMFIREKIFVQSHSNIRYIIMERRKNSTVSENSHKK